MLRTVTMVEVLQFFAIVYYMGHVRLPSKEVYCSQSNTCKSHFVLRNMAKSRFQYLWRSISLIAPEPGEDEGDSDGDEMTENEMEVEKEASKRGGNGKPRPSFIPSMTSPIASASGSASRTASKSR